MLPKNVKNFINSKDTLTSKNSVGFRIIFLSLLLVCCGIEILLFCFKVNFIGKISKLFDLIFTVIIAILGLSNFIVSLFIGYENYHLIYYGITGLLFSIFLFYMGIRIALFPLSEFYGLMGIGLWLIISILSILGILYNIKFDRYNSESVNIFWLKDDKTDEKYGIVINKFTIINFLIVIGIIIIVAVLYFALLPNLFTVREVTFSRVWQLVVTSCLLLLGYVGTFAWKLVIKQFYINKKEFD